jgi:L-lactate dehydrogenase complex protein LldE
MATKVQLFITCLTEQFFPGVLERMVELLERLDVKIEFPQEQTCCGQPFFNSGFHKEAREVARKWVDVFSRTEGLIVSPSGSCVDLVRHHYSELFPAGTPEHARAMEVTTRVREFSEFLVNELKVTDVAARFPHKVTYHASCHLLRGLGITEAPKTLLKNVRDLELVPLEGEQTCCGFGGVFSVIYPEISKSMMEDKIRAIKASGAEAVVACDAGCLMNIAGGMVKSGSPVKVLHLIDVLAARQ